jgi:hypothetical protein
VAEDYSWWEAVWIIGAVAVLMIIAIVQYWQETRRMTPDQKRQWAKDFKDDPENW